MANYLRALSNKYLNGCCLPFIFTHRLHSLQQKNPRCELGNLGSVSSSISWGLCDPGYVLNLSEPQCLHLEDEGKV